MIDIHDNDIQRIEREILWKYEKNASDYPNCDCLLKIRKYIINRKVLAHQEVILPDIIAFNDALTVALREIYERAYRIWNSIRNFPDFGESVGLEAKLFLSFDYPELHPVQGEDRQDFWYALCDAGWNRLYGDGISMMTLNLPEDEETFESFIGIDGEYNNWNEGLDHELTKNLHLTSAFHNIFEHMEFAITDFIYVRKFETEINIEINKNV